MKRAAEESQPQDTNTNPASGSSTESRAKRIKSKVIKACASCRKNKTRCEQPTEPNIGRCHRCNVLRLTCSFEGTDQFAHIRPSPPSTTTPNHTSVVISQSSNESRSLPPPRDTSPEPQIAPPAVALDAFTAEELVVGPTLLEGEAEEGPGYYAQSPLGAIWSIMRKRPPITNPALPPEPVNTSGDIVSLEQTHYLMSLFDKYYTPWLNIPHLRTAPDAPVHISNFLVLACCAVACRHLPSVEATQALSRLQPLADQAVLLRSFDPTSHASLEGVQALLILANWTPAIGALQSQVHDGSIISTTTVRMALALKLDKYSEKALALRKKLKERGFLSDEDRSAYDEFMWKTRLWVSICNTEWSLNTGTFRKPLSVRSPADSEALDWMTFCAAGTVVDHRDFRLSLTGLVTEIAAQGLGKSFKNLDQFYKELDDLISNINFTRNVVQPLRFALTIERMHMDYLLLQENAARLLILFHGMAQIRAWLGAHIQTERHWMKEIEQAGVKFVKQWGIQILDAAQSILGLYLELKERWYDNASVADEMMPLAAAPDGLYATVLFASSILLCSRYTMHRQFSLNSSIFIHAPMQILSQIRDALANVALGSNHAPRRAAAVVHELRRVWHEKIVLPATGEANLDASASTYGQTAQDTSGIGSTGNGSASTSSVSSPYEFGSPQVNAGSPSTSIGTPASTAQSSGIGASTSVPSASFAGAALHPRQYAHMAPQHQQTIDTAQPHHPHPHVDTHTPFNNATRENITHDNNAHFNGLFDNFTHPTNENSRQRQQEQDQLQAMYDPAFLFGQMDPASFLDNGFWDLFGHNVDATAPPLQTFQADFPTAMF